MFGWLYVAVLKFILGPHMGRPTHGLGWPAELKLAPIRYVITDSELLAADLGPMIGWSESA